MSTTKLAVEIMNSSYTWQDVTTDTKHIAISGLGLPSPRTYKSNVGTMKLTLNNQSKAYNPSNNTPDSVLIRDRRRVRVKATQPSLGKALQVQVTSANVGGQQNGYNQTVNTSISIGDVITISYQARAMFDSQFNRDHATIAPNTEGMHFSLISYSNKYVTYTFSYTAGANSTSVQVGADNFTKVPYTGTNARVIEYKNWSLTINGGPNLLVNGNFSNGFTGWSTYAVTGSTTATVIDDYWVIFNGFIDEPKPIPGLYGSLDATINCVDFTSVLQNQNVSLAAQKNQTGDQLNLLALKQLTSYQTVILMDNPIRFYRLNETSGTTANDISGSGQNATYTVGQILGANGQDLIGDSPTLSVRLNGTSQYIVAPTINLGGKNITLECWVNFADVTTPATLITIYNSNGVGQAFTMNVNAGAIRAFDNSLAIISAGSVTTGLWYHLVITIDIKGNANIYINGSLDTSGKLIAFTPTSATPFFGQSGVSSQWFNGNLEEVVIYDHVLNASDISRHYQAGQATYNMARLPGILQDTGKQVFPFAFDGYRISKTSVYDAVAESTGSEYGIQWIDRDGTFRWWARDGLLKQLTKSPKLTLVDGMAFVMELSQPTNAILNEINHSYFPRKTVNSTIVLGSLSTATAIPPVQPDGAPGRVTVTLDFVDPQTSRLIGGDSVLSLVATTDYTVNTAADGSGTDFTSNALFAVGSVIVTASQAAITLKNFSTQTLYATKLQIRGNGVFTLNPVDSTQIDPDSIVKYQKKTKDVSLQFTSDQSFVTALGKYLVSRYKVPIVEVSQVSVDFKSNLGGVDLLGIELMDVFDISDTQSGIINLRHLVIGVAYDLTPEAGDYVGNVTYQLEAVNGAGWILGNSPLSQMSYTTRLFIG